MTDTKYEIPDAEADERTGLSVWPVLADGQEIGRVIERERGYQARIESGDAPWYGPERPFREQAIDDIKRTHEGPGLMDKLNPNALAESGDAELDERASVQPVTEMMIREYVISSEELPRESAKAFAMYIHEAWNDYNEDGELTNGQVIAGALAYWRGNI